MLCIEVIMIDDPGGEVMNDLKHHLTIELSMNVMSEAPSDVTTNDSARNSRSLIHLVK